MINLLPAALSEEYRYARRNVAMRRWVVAGLLAIVGLGLIATYGLLTMQQSKNHLQQQIAASNALFKQEDFTATQAKVQEISTSFKLVVKVLQQEILFSQLLTQIAKVVPAGTELTALTIDQSQTAIDISASASDYVSASQIQVNLADPNNNIFTKADLESITCNYTNPPDPSLPCSVTVKALFGSNSPFLFINSKATP